MVCLQKVWLPAAQMSLGQESEARQNQKANQNAPYRDAKGGLKDPRLSDRIKAMALMSCLPSASASPLVSISRSRLRLSPPFPTAASPSAAAIAAAATAAAPCAEDSNV